MGDTVASIAPWLIPGQTAGDDYARIMAQNRQQGVEQQRLGMQQQEFQQQTQDRASKLAATQAAQNAIKAIPQDDPQRANKIRDIIMQWGLSNGQVSSGMLPQQPPPILDAQTGLPIGGKLPQSQGAISTGNSEFKNKLQDILKSAQAPSAPQAPSASMPSLPSLTGSSQSAPPMPQLPPTNAPAMRIPSAGASQPPPAAQTPHGLLVPNGRGGFTFVKPQQPQQMKPIPKDAIGQGLNGELITNSVPKIPPKALVLKPNDVVFQDGKPVYTNSMPKSVTGGASTIPRLTDTELGLLSGDDQTNYVKSISQAQTNKLGKASSPAKSLPLPKEKGELKKGQRYTTSRGEAVWDGENFVQE